ncbi:mechanosensitive ion channel family protein [Deminuibacter soli]|nr:mechanosensitive ion channel domain-containing protein [Deminuibacter soli]
MAAQHRGFLYHIMANLRLLMPVFLLLCCLPLAAQIQDSLPNQDSIIKVRDSLIRQRDSLNAQSTKDTAPGNFLKKIQKVIENARTSSVADLREDKTRMLQTEIFEAIKKTEQKAKAYMKAGIDTSGINTELANIKAWHALAGDGVFTNRGTSQTHRNLNTTFNLLSILYYRANVRKTELDIFQRKLARFHYEIDSLSSDNSLFIMSPDSATARKYVERLVVTAYEVAPVDSSLKTAITNVEVLQNALNYEVYKLAASLDEVELYQRSISQKTFSREFSNLWVPSTYNRPMQQIIRYSYAKSLLTLKFYVNNNTGKIFLLLLLIAVASIYLRSLKKIYTERELMRNDLSGQLVLRYPVLSAVMIVLNLFQFLFPAPPFVFNAILWVLSAIALHIIFRGFISKYWMRVWLLLLVLFVAACADNLILQASRTERWWMLLLALAGLLTGTIALMKGPKKDLREQWIVYAIGLMTVLQCCAVIANIWGRYNLAKTLLTSSYFNVIIAIMFLWTVRLINEALSLAFSVYNGQERKLFYINFERVGRQAPPLFYLLLIVGWFILFGRNFYAFRLISDPFKTFLAAERSVGSYTFSIDSLLIFVLIMGISVITSRIVSYFASDKQPSGGKPQKEGRTGLGSWLLLVRISIISIGLFFAFAAAGLSLDKITLVLGALGVGVGLGLQTLVNSLVSGLIIAFEKPVNVGDVVEIGGQGGTMKSIGFRSSIITTWDGADLIMPNGDLLSSHLINWTSGGSKRRMNILMGVAYNTDLEKARTLLLQLLSADERIMKYPEPIVQFEAFNNSSIDIKILFWVRQLRDAFTVRSDTIATINEHFKKNDISIPFPQQDIHIHRISNTVDKPAPAPPPAKPGSEPLSRDMGVKE